MQEARPKHQRWIKRPPRPSQGQAPAPARRVAPGMPQFLAACGVGLGAGFLGAVVGGQVLPKAGMGGLFAGLGLVLGFLGVWRGLGGTRQDIRDLFR